MVRVWPLLFIMCYLSHDVITNDVINNNPESDDNPYTFDISPAAHAEMLLTHVTADTLSDMPISEKFEPEPNIGHPPEMKILENKGASKKFVEKIKFENLNALNFPLSLEQTTPANWQPKNFYRLNFDKESQKSHMGGVYQNIMKNALKGYTNFVHNPDDGCQGNHLNRDLNLLVNRIPDFYENSPSTFRGKRELEQMNGSKNQIIDVVEKNVLNSTVKPIATPSTEYNHLKINKRSSNRYPSSYEVEEFPPLMLQLTKSDESVVRSRAEIKKSPRFNPWGGKRAKSDQELHEMLEPSSDPMTLEKRNPFYPWGGKRASTSDENIRRYLGDEDKRGKFYSWGGKRTSDTSDEDDLEKREQGTGAKKVRFHSWGGKRQGFSKPDNIDDEIKRGKFYAWGGKRFDYPVYGGYSKRVSSEPQIVLRVPFNAWGGKRATAAEFEPILGDVYYDAASEEVGRDHLYA